MSAGQLDTLLRRAGRLLLAVELFRALGGGLAILLAAGLAAVAVDAVAGLYPWGLVAGDLLLLALFLCICAYAGRQIWRNLFNARRVARRIETRRELPDSRLINAVDLLDVSRDASNQPLARHAVQMGETIADRLSPLDAVDLRVVFKTLGVGCSALAAVLIAYLAMPRAFAAVVPRFLDPHGDYPPFTLLNFEIAVSPQKIYQGMPVTITAKLSGLERVEQANLVFLNEGIKQSLPMLRQQEGGFVVSVDRAEASREFYIETPSGRSERFPLTVWAVPCFEKADATYQPPKYTGWPSATHSLDRRGIRGLEQTEVVVSVIGNMPLESGRMEIIKQDDKRAPVGTQTVVLTPADGDAKTVTGRFPLNTSGQYRISLTGVNGTTSDDFLEGMITSMPDLNPQVAILDPEPLVAAVEGWKVPVTVQVVDDVGIERIVLFAGVNGWGPDPIHLTLESTQPTVARSRYEFDLAKLGARAGDVITYYVSAYDNYPSGTHFADTQMYAIHVISLAEFKEAARHKFRMDQLADEFDEFRKRLDDLQTQRQEVLDQLDELQKKLARGQALTENELKALSELEARLKEFARQSEQLAKELHDRAKQTQLYDFEASYSETLEELSRQLQTQAATSNNVAEKLANLQKQPSNPASSSALRDSAQKLKKEARPFDGTTQKRGAATAKDIEKMRRADDLVRQGARLRAAILQQRELADHIAQFREKTGLTNDDLERLQRLAKEQDLLRQEIEETKTELEKTATESKNLLPKMSAGALDVCKSLDHLQVGNDQAQAARAARSGDGRSAFQTAELAAKKLESLLSQCCNSNNAAQSGDLDGCFKLPRPGIEQSLQRLSQGRGLPGLGSKGASGSGSGTDGSPVPMDVFGPHQSSQGESDAAQRRGSAPRGRGRGGSNVREKEGRAAESINPTSRQTRHSASGNLNGVPTGYRDQAEAYFKRMAKDE